MNKTKEQQTVDNYRNKMKQRNRRKNMMNKHKSKLVMQSRQNTCVDIIKRSGKNKNKKTNNYECFLKHKRTNYQQNTPNACNTPNAPNTPNACNTCNICNICNTRESRIVFIDCVNTMVYKNNIDHNIDSNINLKMICIDCMNKCKSCPWCRGGSTYKKDNCLINMSIRTHSIINKKDTYSQTKRLKNDPIRIDKLRRRAIRKKTKKEDSMRKYLFERRYNGLFFNSFIYQKYLIN